MNLLPLFESKGGWVLDSQFMDQVGSPFLMAHGLGKPVEDAVATVLSGGENKHLWVKTRDWVSPYGSGEFKVVVNGKAYGPFGVGNGEWHWEDAGVVSLIEGENEIRIHDLTGFDGRVAGLMLLNEDEHPEKMRDEEEIADGGCFDFVVVGGGYAGMCAAVAAARCGVKVALIQDRPVFGGNASSEVRVGPIGRMGLGPYKRNSDLAYELDYISRGAGETSGGLRFPPDDKRLENWVRKESNISVFLSTRVTDVDVVDSNIQAVIATNVETLKRQRIEGKIFCDATGDGMLGVKSGAEYRFAPETFEETGETFAPRKGAPLNGGYGATNYWLTEWSEDEESFPECPWAIRIDKQSAEMSVVKSAVVGDYPYAAGWNWEFGFHVDNVAKGEAIRDYNFRAAYGMWDYLKNRSDDKERLRKARMSWLGYVLGKRAANRIIGDYILTQQDLTEHRVYDDGVVTTTWYLDMHFPHPYNTKYFPGAEFRSFAYDDPNFDNIKSDAVVGKYTPIQPYPIPYRCFYSKNIENLFTAGKDISCTYVGMASVRVENTTAQMGTMVGRAAFLCIKNDWNPRQLGVEHFEELKRVLKNPGCQSWLCLRAKIANLGGRGLKGVIRYYSRVVVHTLRKALGGSYMEELAC